MRENDVYMKIYLENFHNIQEKGERNSCSVLLWIGMECIYLRIENFVRKLFESCETSDQKHSKNGM